MASSVLTTRAPGQSPIDSSAINQFVQLLTGTMTGQPVTIANTLTITNTGTFSSLLTVTGTTTSSNINSSGAVSATGVFTATVLGTSSQRTAFAMGSSGPTIQFGSSIPTSACVPGSLFMNAGGSSTTVLYVCMPNGGTASSSNWDPFTFA